MRRDEKRLRLRKGERDGWKEGRLFKVCFVNIHSEQPNK